MPLLTFVLAIRGSARRRHSVQDVEEVYSAGRVDHCRWTKQLCTQLHSIFHVLRHVSSPRRTHSTGTPAAGTSTLGTPGDRQHLASLGLSRLRHRDVRGLADTACGRIHNMMTGVHVVVWFDN